MSKYRKFTVGYREQTLKLILDSQRPIAKVARELGINEGTLENWVNKYAVSTAMVEELALPDRARLGCASANARTESSGCRTSS